ncbi:MAG: RNA polymerase sigma-70 factor (ECF subfamily) [Polyangiales bacterium]
MAEDSLQQALVEAAEVWARDGLPDSPRAWLTRAAKNRAIDEIRKRQLRKEREPDLVVLHSLQADETPDPDAVRDDMLRLIFTCCHPALSPEVRVALTLRTIAGLTTEEIARAFLTPVPTMAQRIVRAKKKIKDARIPYRVPSGDELRERLSGVLQVIYLVFNEGYGASSGAELVRRDLCRHAIRMGDELVLLFAEQPEVYGLLSLMTLHHSRADTRQTDDGELVLLSDQDRSRWDREAIERGSALARHALMLGTRARTAPGTYALQAAIAALHAEARVAEETDWPQIVGLYEYLLRATPSPVVALNRAVAVAEAFGPAQGLELMDALAEELDGYYLFHSARGELLRRLDDRVAARGAYEAALSRCENQTERRFLEGRIYALRGTLKERGS